jgi:NADH-quinone oxidoreductase subunit E
MKDAAAPDPLDALLHGREDKPHELIEVLMDLQEANGFISEAAMRAVSAQLGLPLPEVYRVATFYKAFSLKPRGRHVVTVCMGTACHVRRAPVLLDQLQGVLGVGAGETTADGMFTVERVNCLGACALGPVVVVDGKYHHHVTPAKLRDVLREVEDPEEEAKCQE